MAVWRKVALVLALLTATSSAQDEDKAGPEESTTDHFVVNRMGDEYFRNLVNEVENWPHVNPADKMHIVREAHGGPGLGGAAQHARSVKSKTVLSNIIGEQHNYGIPMQKGLGSGGTTMIGSGMIGGMSGSRMMLGGMGNRVRDNALKFFTHFKTAFLILYHTLKGADKIVNDISTFIAVGTRFDAIVGSWIENFQRGTQKVK